jgi:multidrug efflux system membrane fusion protein
MRTSSRLSGPIFFGFLAVFLGGCAKRPEAAAPATPPAVSVSQPLQKTVTDSVESTGTLQALESVEIRARVSGWLEKIHFTPRAKVKKDQLLFTIDPRQYKAKLDQAQADLARTKAELELADFEAKRMKDLQKKEAAADVEVARKVAELDRAKGNLAAAQAAVEEAQLNLDYTQIRSPIDGRVSRNLVDVGNLVVGIGQNTLLTTVVNDDSLYSYSDMSENDLLALIRMRNASQSTAPTTQAINAPAFLALADETGYPHAGRVDFVETAVDPNTGTIRCRGVFPNPKEDMFPGMFVRIRVPVGKPATALMVTERALGVDQGQHYLMVVNNKNVAEYRRVTVGLLEEGLRVIKEGLRPGDWVVVNGLQRVRPGMTVSPQRVAMETAMGIATGPSSAPSKSTSGPVSPAH